MIVDSTANHNVFHSKTQSNVFILANKQVSDSENNTVTQKGISSSVPLKLLGLYKSLVLTVFNELWIQWDSSPDTYWHLPGPVNRPLGREFSLPHLAAVSLWRAWEAEQITGVFVKMLLASVSEYKLRFGIWVAFVFGFGEKGVPPFSSDRRKEAWICFWYLFFC